MEVSQSGYYAWRKRLKEPPNPRRKSLEQIIRNCYFENQGRYGSRRVKAELEKKGIRSGRWQIRKIMKELGLKAIGGRKYKLSTTESKGVKAEPNLLLEEKNEEKGKVIVGDITYLPLKGGKFGYLAMWQDKVTRRIIGWSIAERIETELVIKALEKGIKQAQVKAGAIIHSDRGSQYGSKRFREYVKEKGLRQSMSGKGNCYDNAQAESFFSRLKAELLEGGVFADLREAKLEVFSYIEGYYNRVRLHSGLGYKSPMEFEKEIKNNKGEI